MILGHVSGRWSAPPRTWREAFARLANRHATLISTTEASKLALGKVVPGRWDVNRVDLFPGSGECAIAHDPNVWRLASHPYAVPLSRTPFYSESGERKPPVTGLFVPLEHVKGTVIIFAAVHFPSSVEGHGGYTDAYPNRVAAHQEAISAMRGAWIPARKRHPRAARVLAADFNLDFRQPWVREHLAHAFPSMRAAWLRDHLPERGELGHRIVSGHLVGDRLELAPPGSQLLDDVDGLDHTPFITTVRTTP